MYKLYMDITTLLATYREIIIFDTEYTTWEGAQERKWSGLGEYRELVQLSAVRVSLPEKKVITSFSVYIRPVRNPKLSEYFSTLTGIDQNTVDTKGKSCQEAIAAFLDWVGETTCFSYAGLHKTMADGVILAENISLHQLPIVLPKAQFKNIRSIFVAAGVPTDSYNSGKLYQYFNLPLDGHEHNAMHDVDSLTQSLFALY